MSASFRFLRKISVFSILKRLQNLFFNIFDGKVSLAVPQADWLTAFAKTVNETNYFACYRYLLQMLLDC